jgi:hypothetical protein
MSSSYSLMFSLYRIRDIVTATLNVHILRSKYDIINIITMKAAIAKLRKRKRKHNREIKRVKLINRKQNVTTLQTLLSSVHKLS